MVLNVALKNGFEFGDAAISIPVVCEITCGRTNIWMALFGKVVNVKVARCLGIFQSV